MEKFEVQIVLNSHVSRCLPVLRDLLGWLQLLHYSSIFFYVALISFIVFRFLTKVSLEVGPGFFRCVLLFHWRCPRSKDPDLVIIF